jgi:hypothetical protein
MNIHLIESNIATRTNVTRAGARRFLARAGLGASFAAIAAGCAGSAAPADLPAPPEPPHVATAAETDGGTLKPNDFSIPIHGIVPCWFTSGNETLQLLPGPGLTVQGKCFGTGIDWVAIWVENTSSWVNAQWLYGYQQGPWIGVPAANDGTLFLPLGGAGCGETYDIIGYDSSNGYETNWSRQTVWCAP